MMKVTLPAGVLTEMLTGAVACVSKDMTTPNLCAVQLSAVDGIFTAQATDRHRGIIADYGVSPGLKVDRDGTGLIQFADVATILRALPKGKAKETVPVTIAVGDHLMVFDWGTGSQVVENREGMFPNLRALIPSDQTVGPPGQGTFWSGKLLATLDKVPGDAPWTLTCHGDRKPMTARKVDDGRPSWLFLLMPINR